MFPRKNIRCWRGSGYVNTPLLAAGFFIFLLNERDMPEAAVHEEAIPIRGLVDGFSQSKLYLDIVDQKAKDQGIERATAMVVFLNFEYRPDCVKANPNAPLKFLGAFSFSSESK